MVYNIVHWLEWTRPIYFAVTVSGDNKLGLERYLRMEGMVYRLTRTPDRGLNVANSMRNLEETYRLRFMLDEDIYEDDNMQKLSSNYRSAYLQMADQQRVEGDLEGARHSFTRVRERFPFDWRSSYSAATISRQGVGRTQFADITRDYALLADDVLRRELPHIDIFGAYDLERARATAQLLRFVDAPAEAAGLLETVAATASGSRTFLDEVDRILL